MLVLYRILLLYMCNIEIYLKYRNLTETQKYDISEVSTDMQYHPGFICPALLLHCYYNATGGLGVVLEGVLEGSWKGLGEIIGGVLEGSWRRSWRGHVGVLEWVLEGIGVV